MKETIGNVSKNVFNLEKMQGVKVLSEQDKISINGGRTATQRRRQRNQSARRRRR